MCIGHVLDNYINIKDGVSRAAWIDRIVSRAVWIDRTVSRAAWIELRLFTPSMVKKNTPNTCNNLSPTFSSYLSMYPITTYYVLGLDATVECN